MAKDQDKTEQPKADTNAEEQSAKVSLPKRIMVGMDEPSTDDIDEEGSIVVGPPKHRLPKSYKAVIKPITENDNQKSEDAPNNDPSSVEYTSPKNEVQSEQVKQDLPKTKPVESDFKPAEDQVEQAKEDLPKDPEADNNEKPEDKTEGQKPAEKTEIDPKRVKEIEGLIAKHQYFVPIDAVSRKKSIKVSIGLTIIVIGLVLLLFDLMLDSGVILLVQKIPHTHFFSSSSSQH